MGTESSRGSPSAESHSIAAELRPVVRPIDLTNPRRIHIVGIAGAGMRAIARVLLQLGHRVTGSDGAATRFLDELAELGAIVSVGHDAANVDGADLVTRSTAVPNTNVEVAAAIESDTPVHSRAEMLGAIAALRPGILVAGTHGKTTTSSMLAVLLDHAGMDPSFVIGSDVGYFGTGARWASGEPFIVEADESDGTFLALPAAHAIVTSLDPDHLEFYGTADRLTAAFEAFVDGVPGITAVCVDDSDTATLLDHPRVRTYGTAEADLLVSNIAVTGDGTSFDASWKGEPVGQVHIGLPGVHNAMNAAGALLIALELGVGSDDAVAGLARFGGVARRFEPRGEIGGVRFVDDYAHLPAEVEVAVATARAGGWNRVIAAYQPHRFSRTQALGATFATSFRGVDHLVLTDIYPSGESPRPGVSGRIVLDAVKAACPELSISWQPTLDDVATHLAASVGPGDLCLTLGAGDLTTVPDRVIDRLRQRPVAELGWLDDVAPDMTDSEVWRNEPIGPLTTYRVGGAARALVRVGSREDVQLLASAIRDHLPPVVAIGRGSNLLVADRGFDGIALQLGAGFDGIDIDGTTVRVGGALTLPAAARRTVAAGLSGFEWAVGVPGTIGGAVAMNAGGHGSDMAASLIAATVLDLRTGVLEERSGQDLRFGYRTSAIAPHELVLDATLRLAPSAGTASEDLLSEIVRWRREHQPGGQNAGSVFTNPPGDSAGRLIDAAGGKGLRIGTAEVSSKHANFIQADAGGRADDVRRLMQSVVELVEGRFGVVLVPETHLVGFAEPWSIEVGDDR